MSKVILEKGQVIPLNVTRPGIDSSNPCEKASCMMTIEFGAALTRMFGRRNYYLRSVSQGCYFTLDGYRYEAGWPIAAGKKIVRFDTAYRKFCKSRAFAKKNPEQHEAGIAAARKAIEPFSSKAVIHNRSKIPPKVSRERQDQINAARRGKPRRGSGTPSDGSRQLSF